MNFNLFTLFVNGFTIFWGIVIFICISPAVLIFGILYKLYLNFKLQKPSNSVLVIFAFVALALGILIFYLFGNQAVMYVIDQAEKM